MESPKFNSIGSRKSSVYPRDSKGQSFNGQNEELDFATAQFNRQGGDMFRKRMNMFSFDGDNTSSVKSKESSMNTSKKSSENSLMTNRTFDFPNSPNFNPTWKRQENDKNRRRNAHFYQKSYFKKLSKINEQPEESKDEEVVDKKLSRGSTFKNTFFKSGNTSSFYDEIEGKSYLS